MTTTSMIALVDQGGSPRRGSTSALPLGFVRFAAASCHRIRRRRAIPLRHRNSLMLSPELGGGCSGEPPVGAAGTSLPLSRARGIRAVEHLGERGACRAGPSASLHHAWVRHQTWATNRSGRAGHRRDVQPQQPCYRGLIWPPTCRAQRPPRSRSSSARRLRSTTRTASSSAPTRAAWSTANRRATAS
jgi:hypothetical protein